MNDPKNEKKVENNNLHTNSPINEKDKVKKAEDKAVEKGGNEASVAAELKNREHDK
jgi:hypothetical protein